MAYLLNDIWPRFEEDDSAQVAILRAEGNAFCVGADIREPRPTDGMPWATRIHRCWPRNGLNVFKPIVGIVQGYALGMGYVLAVNGCDITIAGQTALFGYPEPRLGMITVPSIMFQAICRSKLALNSTWCHGIENGCYVPTRR